MSDTPRTDAEWTDDYYCSGYVPTEFAQQLERELAEAKKDAERYRYVRSIWGLPDEKFNDAIDAAMKEGGK